MWALRAVSTTEDTEEHGGEALTAECAERAEREIASEQKQAGVIAVAKFSCPGEQKVV